MHDKCLARAGWHLCSGSTIWPLLLVFNEAMGYTGGQATNI